MGRPGGAVGGGWWVGRTGGAFVGDGRALCELCARRPCPTRPALPPPSPLPSSHPITPSQGLYFGRELPADHPDSSLPLHGPNQWPPEAAVPGFRAAVEEAFVALEVVGEALLPLAESGLGVSPGALAATFAGRRAMAFLRPLHYAPRASRPDKARDWDDRGMYGAGGRMGGAAAGGAPSSRQPSLHTSIAPPPGRARGWSPHRLRLCHPTGRGWPRPAGGRDGGREVGAGGRAGVTRVGRCTRALSAQLEALSNPDPAFDRSRSPPWAGGPSLPAPRGRCSSTVATFCPCGRAGVGAPRGTASSFPRPSTGILLPSSMTPPSPPALRRWFETDQEGLEERAAVMGRMATTSWSATERPTQALARRPGTREKVWVRPCEVLN